MGLEYSGPLVKGTTQKLQNLSQPSCIVKKDETLLLLFLITSFVTYFYETNKDSQYKNLKKTLDNVYFKKTLKHLVENLDPKYKKIKHYCIVLA